MITKAEIYGIVVVVLLLGFAAAYFKGYSNGKEAVVQKTLDDNARKMGEYQQVADGRATADDLSRQKALAFVSDIDKRMDSVNAKFAKLPNVVVDARGCERLTDAAGVRWNNVELVPAGSPVDAPGDAVGPVQSPVVPRAK